MGGTVEALYPPDTYSALPTAQVSRGITPVVPRLYPNTPPPDSPNSRPQLFALPQSIIG